MPQSKNFFILKILSERSPCPRLPIYIHILYKIFNLPHVYVLAITISRHFLYQSQFKLSNEVTAKNFTFVSFPMLIFAARCCHGLLYVAFDHSI